MEATVIHLPIRFTYTYNKNFNEACSAVFLRGRMEQGRKAWPWPSRSNFLASSGQSLEKN